MTGFRCHFPFTYDIGWLFRLPLRTRTHNLTPTSSQASTSSLHPQYQSSLLALPYELRRQIYMEILGGYSQAVHIIRMKDILMRFMLDAPRDRSATSWLSGLIVIETLDLRYGLKTGIRCPDNFNFFLVEELKWQVHWEVVAEMKALKRLRAQLSIINHTDDPHHKLGAEDEREILAPLESVTEPEDFVVIVNWTVKADENGHGADHERKRSFRLLTTIG